MVLVTLQGGMGNQLFQFATGFALSKRTKSFLIVDISPFDRSLQHKMSRPFVYELGGLLGYSSHFVIKKRLLAKTVRVFFIIVNLLSTGVVKYHRKLQKKMFDPDERWPFLFEEFKKSGNFYLDGYWQNLDYFIDYKSQIIALFNERKKQAQGRTIGVHVRKGEIKNTQIDLCSKGYYERGIRYIIEARKYKLSEVIVNVFTEDIEWAKDNINFSDLKIHYCFGDIEDTLRDFERMCACDNLVICNSTYSYWAGMVISEKKEAIVVCPNNWWNRIPTSELNLYPAGWVVLKS